MGRLLDGLSDHESYAANVLDDGTLTGTYGDSRTVGAVLAACSCGWAGTTRYPTRETSGDDADTLALHEWEQRHASPLRDAFALEKVRHARETLACEVDTLSRDGRPMAVLQQLSMLKAWADAEQHRYVDQALSSGARWQDVAAAVGDTEHAAHARFRSTLKAEHVT